MGHVNADLPPAGIDRLEGLWQELLDHHLALRRTQELPSPRHGGRTRPAVVSPP